MRDRADSGTKAFWRQVGERFLAALLFGLLVGAALESAALRGVPTVERAQQDGAAFGLRAAVVWNDLLAPMRGNRAGVPLPDGTSPISLLDIDEEGCGALVGYVRCRFDRIGHPEILESVLATADLAEPKIIVFDIFFPSRDEAVASEAGRRLLRQLSASGPPLVAPIAYGNNPDGDITIDWSRSICGRPSCGRLRFAPAFALERFGNARNYPTVVRAQTIPDLDVPPGTTGTDVRIPSLALAALGDRHRAAALESVPMIYSIPSFAHASSPKRRGALMRTYQRSVDYHALSALSKEPDGRSILPSRHGRILIIGTSAPVANDWHDTPIGRMTGMEVVANAVRTMEMGFGSADPGNARVSFITGVLAWLVLAVTIALLLLVRRKRAAALAARGDAGHEPLVDRYSGIAVIILSVALLLELALKLSEAVIRLEDPRLRTGDLDVFFPMLAIFFTTAVEFSLRLIRKIEQLAGLGLSVAGSAFLDLRPTVKRLASALIAPAAAFLSSRSGAAAPRSPVKPVRTRRRRRRKRPPT